VNLLLVRLSSMGDVIHALPLAENAKKAGARVGWVVEPEFAGLLEGNPACERILYADTKGWRRGPFAARTWSGAARLRSEMLAFAADVVVDAQGLWKSAVLARAAGAPVVGFAARERREPASAVLCGTRVRPAVSALHVVDRNLALLAAAGIPAAVRAPDAAYLAMRASPEADAFLAGVSRPFAVFHPGAARAEKTWGEERFAALAGALRARRGWTPVVSWGPGDAERAERLAALVPGAARPPLLDFAGLARVYAAARLFVGGDTGPLHLADAVGTPTLALFGPTDPQRNGPYRDRRGVVGDMRSASDAEVFGRTESL
jgi:heptosyltransferase I